MEIAQRALRMDRRRLDSARIYMKDDVEADQAANSLAETCEIIAEVFPSSCIEIQKVGWVC